ncbi:MAG: MSMEG_0570 family nitrogen starvation response protein [Haliangiales bacterium]
MPEMHLDIRWPDGTRDCCYSPSSVIERYFAPGQRYPLEAFLRRVREALTIASERVRDKYGYYCTAAAAQLDDIESRAGQQRGAGEPDAAQVVEIVAIHAPPRCVVGDAPDPA